LEQRRTSLRRPPAKLEDADADQDGGRRHRAFVVYSMSSSPVSLDRAHNVVETATSTTRRVLWDGEDVLQPVGGDVPRRLWTLQTAAGVTIIERGDAGSAIPPRRPYDYFMAVFPPDQLVRMVELTNDKLATNKQPQLTTGGLLKFFGVLILGTRYEFGHRADLWEIEAGSPLLRRRRLARRLGCSGSGLMTFGRRQPLAGRATAGTRSARRRTGGDLGRVCRVYPLTSICALLSVRTQLC
jgi:hypothetical protein